MKLTTFLLFICFLSFIVGATNTNDTNETININGTDEKVVYIDNSSSVDVKRNETLSIYVEGIYWSFSLGTSTYLQNSKDVELLEIRYINEEDSIYRFRVKETANYYEGFDALIQLENNISGKKLEKSITLHGEKDEIYIEKMKEDLKKTYDIKERVFLVSETSSISVKRNETISLYFERENWSLFWKTRGGLEFSNDIEFLEIKNLDEENTLCRLRIKETARAKELEPVLQFNKRSVGEFYITLYIEEEDNTDGTNDENNIDIINERVIFFDNSNTSIEVKRNEIINIFFSSRTWSFGIMGSPNSNDMEFLGLESVDEIYCYYKFRIKETAKNNILDPVITFIPPYGGFTNEYQVSYTLYIKEDDKAIGLPVYHYEPNSDHIAHIESFSILYVDIKKVINLNTIDIRQRHFTNMNKFNANIDNSDIIDLIDIQSENCPTSEPCIVKETYKYLIKDVKNEDDLPPIELNTVTNDVIDSDNENTYEELVITLKLKSSSDCSLNGYKCCSKSNPKVYYQDEDGDWSVENGDWCIIKDHEVKNTKPKLIRYCDAYYMGYLCCEDLTNLNVKNESDGFTLYSRWGQTPCALHSCIYTGEYPICKNPLTEVVYTDTEKWGLEINDWCVICY